MPSFSLSSFLSFFSLFFLKHFFVPLFSLQVENPHILLVGTHADRVSDEVGQNKLSEVSSSIQEKYGSLLKGSTIMSSAQPERVFLICFSFFLPFFDFLIFLRKGNIFKRPPCLMCPKMPCQSPPNR